MERIIKFTDTDGQEVRLSSTLGFTKAKARKEVKTLTALGCTNIRVFKLLPIFCEHCESEIGVDEIEDTPH